MDVFRCDGCELVGTMTEVEAHVLAEIRRPDGSLKDPHEVRCQGAMKVGGPAYLAHERGTHPMEAIRDAIAGAFAQESMKDL